MTDNIRQNLRHEREAAEKRMLPEQEIPSIVGSGGGGAFSVYKLESIEAARDGAYNCIKQKCVVGSTEPGSDPFTWENADGAVSRKGIVVWDNLSAGHAFEEALALTGDDAVTILCYAGWDDDSFPYIPLYPMGLAFAAPPGLPNTEE